MNNKMRNIFIAMLLACGLPAAATLRPMTLGFNAPQVDGRSNDITPNQGDIIFDTSDSEFWGYAGSSTWINLSGSVTPSLNEISLTSNPNPLSTAYDLALANASGGGFTILLPDARMYQGHVFTLNKVDTGFNIVTISTSDSQNISGYGSVALNTPNESYKIVSDGSNWQILVHYATTQWAAYTPTTTGFGTISSGNFVWRRHEDTIDIAGSFTVGTASATAASITLPNSWSTASSTLIPATRVTGSFYRDTQNEVMTVLMPASSTTLNFAAATGNGHNFTAGNGSALVSNSEVVQLSAANIPISALIP